MAMARSNTQRARISASAAGASGKAENTRAAAFARCRDRIALPCASLQAGREAVRVHGQVEPRRRRGEPAVVETGRPGGEVAPQPEQPCRGTGVFADGEAQVAERDFVGVEAQDLGRGGGALKRQAGAQRSGGGRVGAETGVEQSEAGAGGEQRIPLAVPLARAHDGIAGGDGKGGVSGAFAEVRLPRVPPQRRANALAGVGGRVGKRVEVGANRSSW